MDTLSIKQFYNPNDVELCVLKLSGYIDSTNSDQLDNTLEAVLKSGKKKIIFDFAEVLYVSSAGWGIFVGYVKSVRDLGGDIRIAAMLSEVLDVFNILEFFHIIQEYETLNQAMRSFSNGKPPTTEEKPVQKEETATVFEPIDSLLRQSGVKPSVSVSNGSEVKKVVIVKDDKELHNRRRADVQQPKIKTIVRNSVQTAKPTLQRTVQIHKLPLSERIKILIADHPVLSNKQMRKKLRQEKYGGLKIGAFKLRRILKKLNLETKEKRYRYYLST